MASTPVGSGAASVGSTISVGGGHVYGGMGGPMG
jgi:hypothetical protein